MNLRNWFRPFSTNKSISRTRRPAPKRNLRRRLTVEGLEDRSVPATFVVTNVADTGLGSLRQAMLDANAAPNVGGPDLIKFDIAGTGVHTIQPQSQLPDITDPVIIDGYTQPGASPNSNGPGLGDNAVLQIELDGSQAGANPDDGNTLHLVTGLKLTAGDSTIRGLAINRFAGIGIMLTTNGNNTIAGNFIGTDPSGTIAEGNMDSGVIMPYGQGSNGNTVGGLSAADRNVISGNGDFNLHIEASDCNLVEGNFIGTDANGTKALSTTAGFQSGVLIFRGNNNTIGGTTPNARNLISGNDGLTYGGGVEIDTDFGAGGNQVIGNYIGTDITGEFAVPNQFGINSQSGPVTSPNVFGGTAPGAGNLISGNLNTGISMFGGEIAQGNLIGTDVCGTHSIGNGRGVSLGPRCTLGGTTAAARNIVSGNSGDGVFMIYGGNVVQGNYVGTDISGTAALGNAAQGVLLFHGSNSIVGGTDPGARNIIAASGVADVRLIESTDITIQGNYIGVDKLGNAPPTGASPTTGVAVNDGNTGITIGGTTPGAGNIIGNAYVGIAIAGVNTSGVVVQGNSIGLGADGITPISNGTGVWLYGGTSNNMIGGTALGAGNIIANSLDVGVILDQYYLAPFTTGNSILRNSIYNTSVGTIPYSGLGIDINRTDLSQGPDGPNPNDPGDADVGNNGLQNYPVLTSVASGVGSTTIQGTLSSTPNSTFRVEFFSNSTVKQNGYSEGERYVGYTNVTTDATGDASFNATLATASNASKYVTATATDSAGNTSEFSLAYQAPAKTVSVTTATGGTFIYDGAAHAGSGSVDVVGGTVTLRYAGTGNTSYSSTTPPTNAGTYTVIATYAGDTNYLGSTASAALTIKSKLLEASAWSQGTINIGSNGSIVLHLAVDRGQLYGSDTVASLFNGATFTVKIEKADGTTTYGTLTSVAKVEADGSITVSMKMDDALRADLYDAYVNGQAVNFEVTALANGGNYWLDEHTLSNLLNNGALRYVV